MNGGCRRSVICLLACTAIWACAAGAGASTPASAPAPAAKITHIRVVSDSNYPPYVFLDSEGRPQGYSVDLWRLFEAHTGIQVELLPSDWNTAQQILRDGRADVIDLMFRTPSRDALYSFSRPYVSMPVAIFVDDRIRGVRDVASLHGLAVGVERGDACAEKLRSLGITELREFADYGAVVRASVAGDPLVFCMDDDSATYQLYRHSALQRYHQAFVLYTGQFHRAVRKDNLAMLRTVEQGMAMITPAEVQRLDNRWLERPFVLRNYLRLAGVTVVIVAALVALMLLWVWLLRRTVARRTFDLGAEKSKLRALFDASPDAMFVKDRNGVFIECNERTLQQFKVERNRLLGTTGSQIFGDAFVEKMRLMDEEVVALGQHQTYHLSMPRGEGGSKQLEVIKVPLFAPGGRVVGVLSELRDISERVATEAQLRVWAHAFQYAAFGVVVFDARKGRIVVVNPTFARERGYTPDEMRDMPVDALYPSDIVAARAEARRLIDKRPHSLVETEHVTRDGRRFPVLLDCSVSNDAEGNAEHVVVYVQDISERKRAEGELRLAAAAFQTQEALVITDADGDIQRVNAAFTRLTGITAAEARGKLTILLAAGVDDLKLRQNAWEQLRRDGIWQGEHWVQVKRGEPRAVRTAMSAVLGDDGRVSHYVCTMVDLTREREAHASLDRLTYFDPLTDLPNRRMLLGRLRLALDQSEPSGDALLLIDLDHFKRINDLRGHVLGDRLLALVGERLRLVSEDCGVLGRLGGGTFALLVRCHAADPETRAHLALQCAEKIRQALREPFRLDEQSAVSMTASIGWTELLPGSDSVESVLNEAELAMYSAKAEGRDKVRRFEPAMQIELARREELVHGLRDAITGQTLELYYQAQSNRDGRVIGVEALLRWTRPGGEAVPPDIFIPLAEESGLILSVGEWVLRRACAQLEKWASHPSTRDLVLSVNVSAREFAEQGFVDGVRRIVTETGANPSLLMLEMTESTLLNNIEETATKLADLRAEGIRVSLDDFGTGYSSLAYLSRLPLDQLKIDRSFVARLPDDGTDAMVAQTIISMGRGLGLEVIAEGVETVAQKNFLMEHGCDAFQGYLFAKPVPLRAFEALLDELSVPTPTPTLTRQLESVAERRGC